MTKFKIEAFAGLAMLVIGIVAGHAMTNAPTSAGPAPVATSVAPYDMMIAGGNLPVQAVDSLY